jgi:hypothetical protein
VLLFMKILKNSNSFVLLSVLSLTVSACGQNPNVNSHNPGAVQNHQVAGTPTLATGGKSVIPSQNSAPAPSMPGSLGSPEQMPNLPAGTSPNVILAAQPVDNGNPSVIPKQNGNNGQAPSMPSHLGSPEQMPNLPAGSPANVVLAAQPVDNGNPSVIPRQKNNNTPAPSMPSSLGGQGQMPNLPAGTPANVVLGAQPVDNGNPSVIPRQNNNNNGQAPSMPSSIGGQGQMPNLPAGTPANVVLGAQPVDNGNPSVIPRQNSNNAPAPSMPSSIGGQGQMPNLPAGTPANVGLAAQPVDNGNPSVIPRQNSNNAPAPSMPSSIGGQGQMPNLPAGAQPNVVLAAQPVDNGNPSVIPRQNNGNNGQAPSMPSYLGSPEQMPNLPASAQQNVGLAAQPVDNGNPSVIPRQNNNSPAPPLPAQLTGLSGDPLSNLPPYSAPVVVLAPQQGPQGSQGPAGQGGQTGQNGQDGCGIREFTLQFPVRPFTDAEKILYAKELPYRSTSGNPVADHSNHKIPTLQVGEMSALASGNIPYVANSQVEMAIDLALPISDAVVQIQDLSLKMYVSKLSQERYIDTEMLCLLDEKICSGDVFAASNWQKNINPEFFTDGSRTANDYFVKQYTSRVVGTHPIYKREVSACGEPENVIVKREPIYANGMTLPLSELVAGSGSTAQQVLYGQTPARIASDSSTGLYERTLHIVVADDTYVREDAQLVVTLTADTCKMPNIELKAK